jgi:hypothetical protein
VQAHPVHHVCQREHQLRSRHRRDASC